MLIDSLFVQVSLVTTEEVRWRSTEGVRGSKAKNSLRTEAGAKGENRRRLEGKSLASAINIYNLYCCFSAWCLVWSIIFNAFHFSDI